MKRSIRWQLIFSFLGLSFLIIGSFSVITLNLMSAHFQSYVSGRQEEVITASLEELEESYTVYGAWDEQTVETIGRNLMANGMMASLYGPENELVWASSEGMGHAGMSGSGSMMNGGMANSLQSTESSFTLSNGSETIGELVLRYMGAVAYTEEDLQFMQEMQQNIFFVSLAAAALSVAAASWIARAFSRPLVKVSEFTREIAEGNYQKRIPEETAITELNELTVSVNHLSRQLNNQQDIRNRLSSNIAHEIRTPLTTLKGNVEAMIDGVWEVTPERLQSCYEEIDRITRLIAQIDQINELESRQMLLQKSVFDLTELSRQVAENFKALSAEKQLEVKVSGAPVEIRADKDKINQVLTNLMANAVKFTGPGGHIELNVSREQDKAVFTLTDTGEGIRPEDLAKIFERFYMADPSRNSRLGGRGIGLSIVKSIVTAHNGTISAASTYGRGTTFTLTLPNSAPSREPAPR